MKHLLFVLFFCCLSCSALSQEMNAISRIKIRHADPQLIIMLINAITSFDTSPEMSTNVFNGGFSGGGFSGGYGGSRRG